MSTDPKKTAATTGGTTTGTEKPDELMTVDMAEQNKPVNEQIKAEAQKELKKKSFISKTLHKVAEKVGLVERTTVTPALLKEVEEVDEYRGALLKLYNAMTVLVQPYKDEPLNNAVDSPTEQLRSSLIKLRLTYYEADQDKSKGIECVERMLFDMNERDKEMMKDVQKAMDRIQLYVKKEREQQDENVKKLTELCVNMDQARQAVKHAKTNEDLEKKGCVYQLAIQEFDECANHLHTSYTDLPYVKRLHQYDYINFLRMYENRFTSNYSTVSRAVDELKKMKQQ